MLSSKNIPPSLMTAVTHAFPMKSPLIEGAFCVQSAKYEYERLPSSPCVLSLCQKVSQPPLRVTRVPSQNRVGSGQIALRPTRSERATPENLENLHACKLLASELATLLSERLSTCKAPPFYYTITLANLMIKLVVRRNSSRRANQSRNRFFLDTSPY